MARRIGGIMFLTVNGERLQAKGNFQCNEGVAQKNMLAGNDGVHGYTETPKVPFIEGAITDSEDLNTTDLYELNDATAQVELANGKTFVLEDSVFAGEGTNTSEEGEIAFRMEGTRGRYI